MSKLNRYKVSIFGESYLLVSDESEEHITAASHLVDKLMREIAEKTQITDSKRIAVLVALQLASKNLVDNKLVLQYQQSNDKLLDIVDHELTIHSKNTAYNL